MGFGTEEWRLAFDVAQVLATAAIGIYVYFAQREAIRREAMVGFKADVDQRLDRLKMDVDERLEALDDATERMGAHLQHAPPPAECANRLSRLAVVEEAIRRGPSHEDIKRLHERVDENAKLLHQMHGELSGIARANARIESHLLSAGGTHS